MPAPDSRSHFAAFRLRGSRLPIAATAVPAAAVTAAALGSLRSGLLSGCGRRSLRCPGGRLRSRLLCLLRGLLLRGRRAVVSLVAQPVAAPASVSASVTALAAAAAPLAASGEGLGIVFRALAHTLRQVGLADLALDELLDLVELALLLLRNEGDGAARRCGARRAADAVDVVLGIVRHVVVDDQADILDVDAARHDVGGHQDLDLVVLEVEHHLLALRLLQVGVHRGHLELHALERMGQLLDLHLRRRKDDRLRIGRLGEQFADDPQLLALVADVGRLVDRLVGFRDGDVHLGRISQNGLRQLADLRGQRCRNMIVCRSRGM